MQLLFLLIFLTHVAMAYQLMIWHIFINFLYANTSKWNCFWTCYVNYVRHKFIEYILYFKQNYTKSFAIINNQVWPPKIDAILSLIIYHSISKSLNPNTFSLS